MAHHDKFILTGLLGWPVAHSRSPQIHNHWIAEHGLNGAYVLLPVEPARVWQRLNDADVLVRCIPGCQRMTRINAGNFECEIRVALGSFFLGGIWFIFLHPSVSREGNR